MRSSCASIARNSFLPRSSSISAASASFMSVMSKVPPTNPTSVPSDVEARLPHGLGPAVLAVGAAEPRPRLESARNLDRVAVGALEGFAIVGVNEPADARAADLGLELADEILESAIDEAAALEVAQPDQHRRAVREHLEAGLALADAPARRASRRRCRPAPSPRRRSCSRACDRDARAASTSARCESCTSRSRITTFSITSCTSFSTSSVDVEPDVGERPAHVGRASG